MAKNNVVGKVQIVREMVKENRMDPHDASFVYEIIVTKIRKSLERGQDVLLRGVGRIALVHTKPRKSNMTGVIVPPHKRIRFKPNAFLARKIRVETREYEI